MSNSFTPIIYGLESQARALAPQLAENNAIRFFIATQSLKPNNQLHLVELNEESSCLKSKIFLHSLGEVWKLNSSPFDPKQLISCYAFQKGNQICMQSSIIQLPDSESVGGGQNEYLPVENVETLNTENFGSEIRTTEFHTSDPNLLASVVDNKIILHERTESSTRVVTEICTKNSVKFSTGKWSQHHQGNQFVALYDCNIQSYDVRDPTYCAWTIENAHGQQIRDLDCNPNKQCHLVTGGDDGTLKLWDCRNTKEAIFTRTDHSHWIWNVRFNIFHDQLILSSSTDCKVLLTCAGSVSSEANADNDGKYKEKIPDGLLEVYDQYEDSVYCVEWSNVDPWTFASLSYDGRVIINKVSKQYKYKILL